MVHHIDNSDAAQPHHHAAAPSEGLQFHHVMHNGGHHIGGHHEGLRQSHDGQHHHGGHHIGQEGHHHQYGRAHHESAQHHLPHLSLDGGHHGRHHGGRHNQYEGHHSQYAGHHGQHEGHHGRTRGRHQSYEGRESEPDTGAGSWSRSPGNGGTGDAIAKAAANSVGHQTYLSRHGSEYGTPPAGLGCTSASTNIFFDGLKAAGKVGDRDYGRVHKIGNDDAYASLIRQGIARPVSGHDVRPGDWVYVKRPGHLHGHSGVAFQNSRGELMVANNHMGRTIATRLKDLEAGARTKVLRAI